MAKKPKVKPKAAANAESEPTKEPSVAIELGRIAKLCALYLMRDVDDEGKKVTRLNAVGFSAAEIGALLDKTVINVRAQISQAKAKRGK